MKKKKVEFKAGEVPLKQIRKILGQISQEELARRIGTSAQTVSRWERGAAVPTFTIAQVKSLNRELRHVGLTIEDLPDYLGPPPKNIPAGNRDRQGR